MFRTAFLLSFLAISSLFSAPPDVPAVKYVKAGQLLRLEVVSDVPIGSAKNFSKDDAFFGELISETKGVREFVFQAPFDNPKAQYVIAWWTVGESKGAITTIIVGSPPPKGPNDPPVTEPITSSFYFLIMRKDGPADPSFTKVMMKPAWDTLRTAKHQIRDYTVTQASKDLNIGTKRTDGIARDYLLPDDTVYPIILTLSITTAGSKVVRAPIPMPTDDAGILKLPEVVKP